MTKFPGDARGFTLVEMLMVLAVLGVVFAMATGITPSLINSTKSDSALVSAINAVELARNRSVGERREFQVVFTAPNQIQVIRIEVPTGTTTVLSTFLDNGQQYAKFTGVPATPDAFQSAGGAIA